MGKDMKRGRSLATDYNGTRFGDIGLYSEQSIAYATMLGAQMSGTKGLLRQESVLAYLMEWREACFAEQNVIIWESEGEMGETLIQPEILSWIIDRARISRGNANPRIVNKYIAFQNKNESYEIHIKSALVDFLLKYNKYDLLISELSFLYGGRRADLVAVKGNTTIGFEIKSENDSLKLLHGQLHDYLQAFNRVYLVLSERFANNSGWKNIPHNIGVILIKKNFDFVIIRKATIKVSLDKYALLSLLWRRDLEKLEKEGKSATMEQLIERVSQKCSVKTIQRQVVYSLNARYLTSYKFFLHDRGSRTNIADMQVIRGLKKNLVF
jgi:hypothetical protein